jgi:hypothetical protein
MMHWQTHNILTFFPKVILQTPFAFMILFTILGHLTINLLDISKVIWQDYVHEQRSFSHSGVEMGCSHNSWVWISFTKCGNSKFKTSATGHIHSGFGHTALWNAWDPHQSLLPYVHLLSSMQMAVFGQTIHSTSTINVIFSTRNCRGWVLLCRALGMAIVCARLCTGEWILRWETA